MTITIEQLEQEFLSILERFRTLKAAQPSQTTLNAPQAPLDQDGGMDAPDVDQNALTPEEKAAAKYDWSTPEAARHSLRLICDEEGLTPAQKNLMSQVVNCESGFHTKAVHPNLYDGKLASTDRGICQWNDKYHSSEITSDEAFNNPEKCVRLMCTYVKRGQIKDWVCYTSGLYQKYTP